MNITSTRREAFMLLLSILTLNTFSQTFTDVTPANIIPETQSPDPYNSSRVFWVDIDNDSDLDLFFLEEISDVSQLFRNDGSGIFTKLTVPFHVGQACAFGDINKDGFIDIAMTGNHPKIYLNHGGDGTFTDLDDDGIPDNDRIPYNLDSQPIDLGDYDNDGDLDLVIGSKVFRTNADLTFTWMEALSFIETNNLGKSKWGDFDNDGFPDLFLTGDSPEGKYAKIYRNLGNSAFSEVPGLPFEGLTYASVDVGDYDKDGDIDLILTGNNLQSISYIRIFRNDGNWSFSVPPGLTLPGVWRGDAKWGDIDNDSDLDILIVGWRNSFSSPITTIYKNNGNDNFTQHSFCTSIDPSYPTCFEKQIGSGSVAWGDYDNDGDLDFGLIGMTQFGITEKIYSNNSSSPNQAPGIPTGLSTLVDRSDVTLSWTGTSDTETPSVSLTYNIKVGTSVEINDIMPSNSASSGYRSIIGPGNTGSGNSFILKKLPFGTYHWKVQTVDNGYQGGSFSSDDDFTISPVHASELSAKIINANTLILKWKRGNGDRCIVFSKQTAADLSVPVDGNTYIADSEFGYGDQLGSTGWYCIYNGRNDSIEVNGLLPGKLYSFHVIEYMGSSGSEDYWTTPTPDGNPGVFSTNMFSEQTDIPNNSGMYDKAVWGDYDNDGYLDILVPGNPTRIYKNNGNNTFTEKTGIAFPALEISAAEWGDYNNDGKLDILITGTTVFSQVPFTKIFRNDGGDVFTEQTLISLAQVCMGSVAWGDYNNDGNLDILLNGSTTKPDSYVYLLPGTPVTKVYTNNGNNTFTELAGTNLTPLSKGYVRWGDIDNDGDLDIAITGFTDLNVNRTEIYSNNGNGTFTPKFQVTHPGSRVSYISLGDFDKDSDLDLLVSNTNGLLLYKNLNNFNFQQDLNIDRLSGSEACWAGWTDFDNDGYLDFIFTNPGSYTKMYRNTHGMQIPGAVSDWFILQYNDLIRTGNGYADWGDYDNDGDNDLLLSCYYNVPFKVLRNSLIMKSGSFQTNRTPQIPQNAISVNTPDGVILSWDPVSGDESVPENISYNLRIGTTDGIWNFCPPQSLSDGNRSVTRTGNVQIGTTYILKNLPSGTYHWSVQAVDNGYKGSSWSTTKTFEVKNVQTFYSFDEVCLGLPTHFTDQSVATKGILSWLWDFGDGTSSTSQNPQHTYGTSGTFNVKLTITDTESATDFLIKSVNVKAKPSTDFTAPIVCQGIPTSFTNTTNNNLLTISSWFWDFGDGQSAIVQGPPAHGYLGAADYTVLLRAQADNGCIDEISKTVTVAGYPVGAVSADGATTFCTGQSVTLSTPLNADYTYIWKREGSSITGATSNTYLAQITGSYTVSVTNTKGNCTTISFAVPVIANTAPAAPLISSAGPLTFCQGDTTVLSVENTTGYSYQWKLNGGAVGSNSNIYSANTSGTYSLIVTNSSGCSVNSTNSIAVTVDPNPSIPTVNLSGPTAFCQGGNVELSFTSIPDHEYQWENNGAGITGAINSSFIAQNSGNYSLKVSNSYGCSSKTENVTVNVSTAPSAPLISAGSSLTFCQGESVILSVDNTSGYSYQWKLNGGAVGTDSNQYTAKNSGNYTLQVSNSNGCSVSSTNSVDVTVNPLPVVSDINLVGVEKFCKGGKATLSVPANANYSYTWKEGTNDLQLTSNSIDAAESGEYSVEVSLAGCKVTTAPRKIEVVDKPARPDIDYGTYKKDDCLGENPPELSVDNIVSGYSYQWYKNETPISNSTSIEVIESGNYYLEAVVDICSSERALAEIVFKKTLPKPDIIAKGPTIWYLSTTSKASYYRWYYNGNQIKGADNSVYVAGQKMGTYRVSISDDDSCFVFSNNIEIPTGITGIEDADPFENVVIYPNPTTGMFTIEMDNNIFGDLFIDIFTPNGSKALNIKFEKTTEHFSSQIDLSGQSKGMYLINLSIDKYIATRKILIE